ncbi:hypothetical protein MATL_G00040430 [Megalops atlanticus]|uniref:Lysosomal proton-coupled steroid conjugate and bile acid symporter SLC46A3 n=1 Tax=Megalops atlanticus TaxID=7932 RepID=A0A9D3Q9V0_MEGAT|nr:hypothetical protein MATL_G00040430 [Megalops atlanticus]
MRAPAPAGTDTYTHRLNPGVTMRRLYLIEPVVGVYAFAMFMTYPLLQQYIYRRLWTQLTSTPYPSSQNFSHCEDGNTSLSSQHDAVQREASLFFLYSELCFLFPSLVMSLLLVSCSDHCGRLSHFSLSLNLLLGASFLTGLLGGPTSLIGGCFAYLADRCSDGRKTVRMALLDMLLGLLSGLASLCTGFFIRAAGFTWPFLTAALLHFLNLAYVLCGLRETVEPGGPVAGPGGPSWEAVRRRFQGAYLLLAASPRRRRTLLVLTLLAFAFYKVAKLGGMSIFILYELNTPLCWSELLVGYGSALSTAIYMGSFAGVYILSRCLRDAYIVLFGLLSVAAGMIVAAFAKTTLMMFLVRLPLLFSIMPTPVLRSMMSKMVRSSEQGAVFGCVAFVEMLSVGVAFTVFSSTYAATVSWFSGFSFLLASGLTLIPMALIGSVLCLRLDVDDDTQVLTNKDDDEIPGETLQMPSWDTS